MTGEVREYVHKDLDETVMAIGGHYRFTDEVRLPVEGGEVLYLKGYALFDATCCGAGGCAYALVYGMVEQWKGTTDKQGFHVSRIRPVADEMRRREITRRIREKEMLQQVQFV